MWNGQRFKQLLNDRSIVKKNFAQNTLGKDRGNLSHYYSAKDISFGQACKFADELNVSLDYLGNRSDFLTNAGSVNGDNNLVGTINILHHDDLVATCESQRETIDELRKSLIDEKDQRIKLLENLNNEILKSRKSGTEYGQK